MLLGPFADSPMGEWERMVDINVLGLLFITKVNEVFVRAADQSW